MLLPKKLPKALRQEFQHFLETHSPQEFNNNLRTVLLDYMHKNVDMLPNFFDEFIWAMSDFFCLMDVAAKEIGPWEES